MQPKLVAIVLLCLPLGAAGAMAQAPKLEITKPEDATKLRWIRRTIPGDPGEVGKGVEPKPGALAAIIENENGSSLRIVCPKADGFFVGTDRIPELIVESTRKRPGPNEAATIEITIDGRKLRFDLQSTRYIAGGRGFLQHLFSLTDALSNSKSSTFSVSYAGSSTVERFSTLGAKEAIGEKRNTIAANGCMDEADLDLYFPPPAARDTPARPKR